MIKYIDSVGKSPVHNVPLVIEIDGMTITVKAGAFTLGGQALELKEDHEYTVTPLPSDPLWIDASIVQEIATGAISVLVDEIAPGESNYVFEGSPYKKLLSLYWAEIPAGATSLDDVEITVSRIVEG